MPASEYRARNRALIAHGLTGGWNGDRDNNDDRTVDAQVDEALDALEAVAERPVRSTVTALRP